jgi:3,4-dihydroxy 2-butanone 4-phosphate synthase/GTP cyclohydrolase II
MAISSIEEVLQDIREGRMVIIVDDEDRRRGRRHDRRREGDARGDHLMARFACGLICLSLTEDRVNSSTFPSCTGKHSPYNTAFTVSIEAKEAYHRHIRLRRPDHTGRRRPGSTATTYHGGHIFPWPPAAGRPRAGRPHRGIRDLARLPGSTLRASFARS